MTPAEVMQKLSEYCNKSIPELSNAAGYDRPQAFYDVINGKTKAVSPKMADKLSSVFPEISRAWILTGEGEMLKTSAPSQQKESADVIQMPREVFNQINDLVTTVKSQQTSIEALARSVETLSQKGADVGKNGHAAPQAAHG